MPAPVSAILPWSEEALRERVKRRAVELGLTLARAGIDKSNFYRGPARRLDTLTRLAEACGWDLPQILGVPLAEPLSQDLLLLAYQGAERYLEKLPTKTRTRDAFVGMMAGLYDLAAARRRRGKPLDISDLNDLAPLIGAAQAQGAQFFAGHRPDAASGNRRGPKVTQ